MSFAAKERIVQCRRCGSEFTTKSVLKSCCDACQELINHNRQHGVNQLRRRQRAALRDRMKGK